MHHGGGGGGFGGMMGNMRGLNAGGMRTPNMDNLSDEERLGNPYDNKVVMRLGSYVRDYKRDTLISLAAVLVYTSANVAIPLFILFGVDWAIAEGNLGRLHLVGLGFLVITLVNSSVADQFLVSPLLNNFPVT